MRKSFLEILILSLSITATSSSTITSPLTHSLGSLFPGGIDLWIVGAGTLGELIVKEWMKENPSASIIAETLSPQRHQVLRNLGAQPILRSER
jgi:D-arabinose 1-dehydrogenase-like Zn-dependent alcohol dehydrogenase